ncbi:hypothetical protein [Noviluteimonas gilva]|uniref:Uncharacterized protein n=1 Tax=Noviluteimonas gilva TaxID=2682097 RepID=A0A7C9LLW6_9GAMM|nr:hypothetical protein [Lysobacter gilvus]MUV13543.1 hypothetical protein [Lysobacter gilvus]
MSPVNVLAVMDGARRTISAQSKLSDDVMAHIADDVANARAAVAELIERVDYLCRTGEGMIALRAALKHVRGDA